MLTPIIGRGLPMRGALRVIRDAAEGWLNHDAMTLAAALAFYVLFSLPPLLIIAVALGSVFFDASAGQQEILDQMQIVIGRQPAKLVAVFLEYRREFTSLGSLILGGAVLLYSATAMFTMLQHAMNRVWSLEPRDGIGWGPFFRKRLLSFLMVLAVGAMLIVSLALSQALSAINTIGERLPFWVQVLWLLNYILTYTLVMVFLVMVYRVLPDASIPWRGVMVGAAVTTLLFVVGNILIGLYLAMGRQATAYGAAQSVLAFLLWVYYSGLIFFYGAEIGRAYTDQRLPPVEPEAHARRAMKE